MSHVLKPILEGKNLDTRDKRQKGKEFIVKFMEEATTLAPDCALKKHPKAINHNVRPRKSKFYMVGWECLKFEMPAKFVFEAILFFK